MKFAIFRRKFDEILPEFHRNVQEMTNCLDILRKSAKKIRKMLEISGNCEKFSSFISSFHSSPYYFRAQCDGKRQAPALGLFSKMRRSSTKGLVPRAAVIEES
jgi:hypothetical protein